MDFSPFSGPSWGKDEITPYNPMNSNMYDIFIQNSDVQPKISNPLNIPPRKFPSPQQKVQTSPMVIPKKEGFVGGVELSDDMIIIILLIILIMVCVSIHNTVQRIFDSIQSLSLLLATKNT